MYLEKDKKFFKKLLAIVLFVIALGYIESAVVVYLRAIFYPEGFNFPLANIEGILGSGRLLVTEIGREAATLIVIFASSYLLGSNLRSRSAYFLIIFAVWDISYYIWLKILINWPASFMDWDILFLIPITWAAPVLAPIISSLMMLAISALLLSNRKLEMTRPKAGILFIAALAIITLFCYTGQGITEPAYRAYFNWPIFIILHLVITATLFAPAKK